MNECIGYLYIIFRNMRQHRALPAPVSPHFPSHVQREIVIWSIHSYMDHSRTSQNHRKRETPRNGYLPPFFVHPPNSRLCTIWRTPYPTIGKRRDPWCPHSLENMRKILDSIKGQYQTLGFKKSAKSAKSAKIAKMALF